MEPTWSGAEAAMKMKLDELKHLAEKVGVKQPRVSWAVCCPPNGRKEDIVRALCQYFNLAIPTTPTYPKTTPILPITTDRNRPKAGVDEDSSSKTRVDLLREKLTVTYLGNLKQGDLYRVVTEDEPLYAEMIKSQKLEPVTGSVRMPYFKPHVCVSFASSDLVGCGAGRENVNDGKAGAEPWAICDYIRETLYWPMDFIFIDAEQAVAQL